MHVHLHYTSDRQLDPLQVGIPVAIWIRLLEILLD
jgi:hypothetical protein